MCRTVAKAKPNVTQASIETLASAVAAGVTDVLIVDPEPGQLVAVRRKDWSPSEAIAYAIADNRTAELAEWDGVPLAEQLRALQFEDFGLEAVGYEDGEVDALLARLGGEIVPDFQPASIDDQGRLDEKAKVECPSCGHEFTP